ncbi:MAG: T9SS type A sorting domain-containing protein [Bacteroidota bacterium]
MTVTEDGDAPSSFTEAQILPPVEEIESVQTSLEPHAADVFYFKPAPKAFDELLGVAPESELINQGPTAGERPMRTWSFIRNSLDGDLRNRSYGADARPLTFFRRQAGEGFWYAGTVGLSTPPEVVDDVVTVTNPNNVTIELDSPGLTFPLRQPIPVIRELSRAVCARDVVDVLDPGVDAHSAVLDLDDPAQRYWGLRVPLNPDNPITLKGYGLNPVDAVIWLYDGSEYVQVPQVRGDEGEINQFLLERGTNPYNQVGLSPRIGTQDLISTYGDEFTEMVVIWGLVQFDPDRPNCVLEELRSGYSVRRARFHIKVVNPAADIDAASIEVTRRPDGDVLRMRVERAAQVTSYLARNNATGEVAVLRPWDEFARAGDADVIDAHWRFEDGRVYTFALPEGFVDAETLDLTISPVAFGPYHERTLDASAVDVTTTMVGNDEGRPETTALALDVYPNPLADQGTVALTLSAAADVQVALYDLLGRQVARIHDGPLTAGRHRLVVDVTGQATGTFLVRAQTRVRYQATREHQGGVLLQRLVVVR